MDSSLTNDGMGGRVLLATERAFFSTNLLMSCGAGDGTGLVVQHFLRFGGQEKMKSGGLEEETAPEIVIIYRRTCLVVYYCKARFQ